MSVAKQNSPPGRRGHKGGTEKEKSLCPLCVLCVCGAENFLGNVLEKEERRALKVRARLSSLTFVPVLLEEEAYADLRREGLADPVAGDVITHRITNLQEVWI